MKKTALTMALATALGLAASVANAASVTSMTLADTINANGTAITTDDTLGTDTRSGAFRFNNINLGTYAGSSFFSGNVNGGAINVAAANTAGSFSTGFDYLGQMFIPFTAGPINADITGGVLTVTSLPWGGNYGGATNFFLSPDAGSLFVNNLVALNATDYAYRMSWSHLITDSEDPSGGFVGFTTRWVIEGVMSTATANPVPVPAAAWLMGSGLLGLAGVARRRRSV